MNLLISIETDGLFNEILVLFGLESPHLVKISWALCDDFSHIFQKESYLIKPDGFIIPENISQLNGITNEYAFQHGIPLETALKRFKTALIVCDIIIAHNVGFVKNVLKEEFKKVQLEYNFDDIFSICTSKDTTTFCNLPNNKFPTLAELSEKVLTSKGLNQNRNSKLDLLIDSYFYLRSTNSFNQDIQKNITIQAACKNAAPYNIKNKWFFRFSDVSSDDEFLFDDIDFFGSDVYLVKKMNLWGLLEKSGKMLSQPKYTSYKVIDTKYCLFEVNGCRWGLADNTGNITIPCEYDKVEIYDQCVLLNKNGTWGVADKTGNIILPCVFNKVGTVKDQWIKVNIDDKWGFFNLFSKKQYPCIYDEVAEFAEDISIVKIGNEWQLIDSNLERISDVLCDEAHPFSDGLAAVKLNSKWGFINKEGKIVIESQFEYVGSFNNGLAAIKVNGKWGFINKKGVIIIKPEHSKYQNFNNGVAILDNSSIYDQSGNLLIHYNYISEFSNGVALVVQYENPDYIGTWRIGYITKDGKTLIPCDHRLTSRKNFCGIGQKIGYFETGYEVLKDINGKYIVYNSKGEYHKEIHLDFPFDITGVKYCSDKAILIERLGKYEDNLDELELPEFLQTAVIDIDGTFIKPFKTYADILIENGLVRFVEPMKTGLYSIHGKEVADCAFDKIYYPTPNLIAVRKEGKYGFIDLKRNFHLPCMYEGAGQVQHGLITTKYKGKWGIIDYKGYIALNFEYDEVIILSTNLFAGRIGKSYALFTKDKALSEYTFDIKRELFDKKNQHLTTGVFSFIKDSKWGGINSEGIQVIPFEFDDYRPNNYNLPIFKKGDKWGMFSIDGNLIVPFKYDNLEPLNKHLLSYTLDGVKGVYSIINGQIFPNKSKITFNNKANVPNESFQPDYTQIDSKPYECLLTIFKKEDGFELIKSFEIIDNDDPYYTPYLYDFIKYYYGTNEERMPFFKTSPYLLYNSIDNYFFHLSQNGDVIYHTKEYLKDEFPLQERGHYYSHKKNDKRGVWDANYEPIIPNTYDVVKYVENDLIEVRKYYSYFMDIDGIIYNDNFSKATSNNNDIVK